MFNTLLVNPLFNAMVFIYDILPNHDIATTIIVLTLIIKIILLPFAAKAHKNGLKLQKIQPELDEIQKKHKDDKQKAGVEIMALYKREGISYTSTCLTQVIQIVVLIAIYRVFYTGLHIDKLDSLYSFIPRPEIINTVTYFGIDLGQPVIVIAVLAGIAQFVQAKTMMTKNIKKPDSSTSQMQSMTQSFAKSMMYVGPILTVWLGAKFPGALALYWLVSVGFSAIQQIIINKHVKQEIIKNIEPQKTISETH